MNCLIVDDQKVFREVIKRMLKLDPSLILMGECSDAMEAHQMIMVNPVDIIFLDIHMPGMSGLDLAKILENKRPVIIFITSKAEYAVEAFNLNVVDFLVKPILPARFLKAVEKARQVIKTKNLESGIKNSEFVFIRDSNTIRKLKIDDILYLEATGDYVKVSLSDRNYFIHSSLKVLEGKLPGSVFLRVHRSFIINLNKIDTIEGKTLVIERHLIPVSDAYRTNLNKRMQII